MSHISENAKSKKTGYIFLLLPTCRDHLISAPKIRTFFPMLLFVIEECERESNPMPKVLYLYSSGSAFLVSSTDPNKRLYIVKYVIKFLNHEVGV